MEKLYWLDQIKPQDRAKVGEKAFQLSRIMQRGYPIVPGFVVSAEVLREFLENLDSSEALVADLPHSSLHLDVSNWRQLQQVASRLRQEIITATVPPDFLSTILKASQKWESAFLIFRPTVALPNAKNGVGNISGLLESQFCRCEEEAIALALKRTWSQLFRARSLLYWQNLGIDLQQINLAVLVQPLRNAIASGSLKANSNQWEIQATWGLGMAISNGEVLPDVYYIQPENGTVQERQLGNKMLAYRLNDTVSEAATQYVPLLAPDNTSLVSYVLEPAQQNQYALPEEYLQPLIHIANQLVKELGSHFTVEWTISVNATETLYLTQVSTATPTTSNFHFMKGLGAAGGRVTGTAYVIINSQQQPEQLPKEFILVATVIAPDWLPLLQQASGIVTEQGGLTSHAAILARELGIPAVVSVVNATTIIQNGERLVVDGDQGEVYRVIKGTSGVGEAEESKLTADERRRTQIEKTNTRTPDASTSRQSLSPVAHGGNLQDGSGLPDSRLKSGNPPSVLSSRTHKLVRQRSTAVQNHAASLKSGNPPTRVASKSKIQNPVSTIATQLLVNLSQPSSIAQVQNLRVDGVGLLRSELMALNILEGKDPNSWLREERKAQLLERWCDLVMQFALGFAPRPVFYRSLDWRSHELLSSNYSLKSSTQGMLGERGTFSYIENQAIFELELAALAAVQKAGYSNIQLLLPFVRTVEEFSFCRQKVEQAMLTQVPQFQLWIMAEVPSILFLLPEYVKAGVQGISIGTNDLTQLILGVDREQGHLATVFNERHPAVMGAIAQIIQMATSAGIPCSICGQAPALYPEIIEQLVQWGITSISVEPEAIERTYEAIARAEQKLILQAARRQLNQQ